MADLLDEFLAESTEHEAETIARVSRTRRFGREVLSFNRHNVTFDAEARTFRIEDELDPTRPPEVIDADELDRLLRSA